MVRMKVADILYKDMKVNGGIYKTRCAISISWVPTAHKLLLLIENYRTAKHLDNAFASEVQINNISIWPCFFNYRLPYL
jgi:hypothetical protein